MATLSNNFINWWKRHFEHIDNIVCVGVFFAAGMPAIIIMLLLSLPLLPFFGMCLCIGAGMPARSEPSPEELEADHSQRRQSDRPGPGAAATPRYA